MHRIVLFVVYRMLMGPLLRILLGIKWKGAYRELKQQKQFIIVANHNSHIDTMALMSSLSFWQLKYTHPVAAATYFGKKKWLGWLTRFFVNTILIKRSHEGTGPKALDVLQKYISKGHSLIIFPEGSRGEPEKLQAFHKGIGVLLEQNPQIPFVPVWITGTGKILPKGALLTVPFEASLTFGVPQFTKTKEVQEIVEEVENAILKLNATFIP
ncbi:MAG: lysophospholipid acyltransferase family protein [Sphingomonadales bacterium]